MVMENEIRLGDIMDKLTPSDRVVIYNAARQVVYRGYAANAVEPRNKCGTRRKQTACRSRCQLNNSHNTGWKTCNTFCISELN